MTMYTPETILTAVALHYGLSDRELRGPSRRQRVTRARQVAMFMLHRDAGLSSVAIGELLQRDHSTVLHGINRIARSRPQEATVALDWRVIQTDLALRKSTAEVGS